MLKETEFKASMSDLNCEPVLYFIIASETKNLLVSVPELSILPNVIAIVTESSVGETVAVMPEPDENFKVCPVEIVACVDASSPITKVELEFAIC